MLLQIGTNDATSNDPNHPFGDYPTSPAQYSGDLQLAIDALRAQNAGLPIWVARLPWRNDGTSTDAAQRQQRTQAFNSEIANLLDPTAAGYNGHYAGTPTFLGPDFYAHFAANPGQLVALNPSDGSSDGLHPSAQGLHEMARLWAQTLCDSPLLPPEPALGDPTATSSPTQTPSLTATPPACFTVSRSYPNDWQSLRDAGIANANGYRFRRIGSTSVNLSRRDGSAWRFISGLNSTPTTFTFTSQARLSRGSSGTFTVEICPPASLTATATRTATATSTPTPSEETTPQATETPTVTATETPMATNTATASPTAATQSCFTVTRSYPSDWQSLRDAGIGNAGGYTFRRLSSSGVNIAYRDGANWRFISSLSSTAYSFAFNNEARLYRSQAGTFSVEVCPPPSGLANIDPNQFRVYLPVLVQN